MYTITLLCTNAVVCCEKRFWIKQMFAYSKYITQHLFGSYVSTILFNLQYLSKIWFCTFLVFCPLNFFKELFLMFAKCDTRFCRHCNNYENSFYSRVSIKNICLSEYLTYQQLELRKMSKSYLGSYNWYLKIKLLDLADTAMFWECMYRQIISPSTRSSRTLGVHFLGKTMSFELIVQTAAQLQFKESKESPPKFLTGWTNLWSPMRTTSASNIAVVR